MKPGESPYQVQLSTIKAFGGRVEADVVNSRNGVVLRLQLIALEEGVLRMRLDEPNAQVARFEPKEALADNIREDRWGLLLFLGSRGVYVPLQSAGSSFVQYRCSHGGRAALRSINIPFVEYWCTIVEYWYSLRGISVLPSTSITALFSKYWYFMVY